MQVKDKPLHDEDITLSANWIIILNSGDTFDGNNKTITIAPSLGENYIGFLTDTTPHASGSGVAALDVNNKEPSHIWAHYQTDDAGDND